MVRRGKYCMLCIRLAFMSNFPSRPMQPETHLSVRDILHNCNYVPILDISIVGFPCVLITNIITNTQTVFIIIIIISTNFCCGPIYCNIHFLMKTNDICSLLYPSESQVIFLCNVPCPSSCVCGTDTYNRV